jgi:hypothetical protein
MYGKIFASIYDGTLRADWKALVTFQQMIVLSTADGIVDITPQALAARTGIPLDIIEAGVKALEAPDPYSRSSECEGRRIARLDSHREWGWVIVNHEKYRDLRKASDRREYMRNFMRKKRANTTSVSSAANTKLTDVDTANSKHSLARLANTDTDTDTDKNTTKFDRFWAAYPRKASKGQAKQWFSRVNPDERLLQQILAGIERAKGSDQWRKDGGKFIPYPATWLRAVGWQDEYPQDGAPADVVYRNGQALIGGRFVA